MHDVYLRHAMSQETLTKGGPIFRHLEEGGVPVLSCFLTRLRDIGCQFIEHNVKGRCKKECLTEELLYAQ